MLWSGCPSTSFVALYVLVSGNVTELDESCTGMDGNNKLVKVRESMSLQGGLYDFLRLSS